MTVAAMNELSFLGAAAATTRIHSVIRSSGDVCAIKHKNGYQSLTGRRQVDLDHTETGLLSEHVQRADFADEWRITVVTYNMNKRRAPSSSIDIFSFFSEEEVNKSDIIVMGLQEISHWELFGGERWCKKFSDLLCERNFIQLSLPATAEPRLGTNQMLIFVKERILMSIRKTEGIAGHKAAVGVKISFKNGSYILLIACHLCARPEAYSRRVNEYNSTKSVMTFAKPSSKEHGYTFWLGDLNFRVNDLSAAEIVGRLKNTSSEQMYTLLDQHDQLKMAQKIGDAFVDCIEPNVTFPPTYRKTVGSGDYDLVRVPSWCDRILYRVSDSVESLAVKALSYDSLPSVQFSDHLPVKGAFTVRMTTATEASAAGKWTIRFDMSTDFVRLLNESFVTIRFQVGGCFWKKNGSFFDWIGVYKDHMTDTRQPATWKYVLSCWDDQIGGETWTHANFAGLTSGRYRAGYYSRYCDCIVDLSEPFEARSQKHVTGGQSSVFGRCYGDSQSQLAAPRSHVSGYAPVLYSFKSLPFCDFAYGEFM